jgi:putative chitinase
MLTADILQQLWPHAAQDLRDGIIDAAPAVFANNGLTSDLLIAHAMAQFSEECLAGTELVENLNYSAQGLMNTWPTRFNAALAAECAGNQELIANKVYNGRMGNAPGSDDGWTFRGRGGSQLTGRDAYTKLGPLLGLNLVGNPDLVNDPANFLACAVADFVMCGCLPFAAADDVSGVTYHLNGGYNGLAQRTTWLAQWKAALAVNGADAHGTLWVQQSLNKLGTEPPIATDGSYGPMTAAAVQTFQTAQGLPADGKIDPATITAIERALGHAAGQE